jgi:hypothetical protein
MFQVFHPTYWWPSVEREIPIQVTPVSFASLPAIEEVSISNKQIKLFNDYSEKAKLTSYVLDLQKHIRVWIVRQEMAKIDQIRENLLQKTAAFDDTIKRLERQELEVIKHKTKLQDELESNDIIIKDIQIKIINIFEQKNIVSGSNDLEKRIAKCTKRIGSLFISISKAREEKEVAIAEAESTIDTILTNLTKQKNEPQIPPQIPKVIPCDRLLDDIGCYAHQQLRALISQIFEKVPKESVLSWEYQNHDPSRKFKIVLKSPVKIWILPTGDDGSYDVRTPRGVILILGNKMEHAICGTFEKEQPAINFTSGFDTFCYYAQKVVLKTFSGYAAGKLDCLSYDEKKERIFTRTTSTALGYNITQTSNDSSHFKTLIQVWKKGIVFTEPNEAFLEKQLYTVDLSAF